MNTNQFNSWANDFFSFFTSEEINELTTELLEAYLHSHGANNQKEREKMYFFLKKLKGLSKN
ncbi:hypothetical protein JJL45_05125 [Tamlana sp. s12]|uniref:hypothetical protein n=1 Tax=Tamlana sp. s12 TaxID=1630406 RepID=UPI0007FE07E3|nr:hypothetical protein [Tamlana sp. s12]OBQ56114.1 hypothetical protein VQ01_06935 [Tamlana sp. s12]QQY83373.1 hypothetical protein JJL45_05125 [Tamlana sp. s12]